MARRILLIQHDPLAARFSQDALSRDDRDQFCIEWIQTCAEAVKRLIDDAGQAASEQLCAAVVDLDLPDSQETETLERLFHADSQLPLLILTGSRNHEVAKSAARRGAIDCFPLARIDGYFFPKILNLLIRHAATLEELHLEKERSHVTLNAIGDAVISADRSGLVTQMNTTAEAMTGWSSVEAIGRHLTDVFHVVDSAPGLEVPSSMVSAMRSDRIVTVSPHSTLLRRDGVEVAIEESAAPIHDRRGMVAGGVTVWHDVSDAHSLSLRMAYLAQHDDLTNLPNRGLLNERLGHDIALAKRCHGRLAVLFLDLDRFKNVNDTLGHLIGDQLLQNVSKRLLSCMRSSDTVSRQGGDEFVVLLSTLLHAEDADIAARKVLSALSAPYLIDGNELHLTVSVGISTYPEDGVDAEALMKNADMAMYHAKETGRNNYKFFNRAMNARAIERQRVESDLHHAVARQEFVLDYQPIIDLSTGKILSVEALIRWPRPNGLMSPTDFIPIAEHSGQIVAIGQWVLREACRQAQAWRAAGLPALRVAVNISTVELRSKDFGDRVKDILLETGLPPDCLELELTETFLMQDPQAMAVILRALRHFGVHLALDDFGTGYSSLTHLKRFPIDTLKIDRAFIDGLNSDCDDACIVSAVINMGKSLNMRVIAEGIETRKQLSYLQAYKCSAGQGYFLSRPLSALECTRLLHASIVPICN